MTSTRLGLYSLFIAYDGESKVVRSWDGLAAILTVKMIIRNENFTRPELEAKTADNRCQPAF